MGDKSKLRGGSEFHSLGAIKVGMIYAVSSRSSVP